VPCCFVDADSAKAGREVLGLPVLPDNDDTLARIKAMQVQEIVFALPNIPIERKKELYDYYIQTGCKVKIYDFPVMQTAENGKRYVREFDIEDLLFRQPIELHSEATSHYYKGKVVLITGGGGSIGSELGRQIARMNPKRLVILDVYENDAYNLQHELGMVYGDQLDLQVEIVSVCDRKGLACVFKRHHPDIVLHAAAHKHVPLMEHNCCEAVKNNVFGTLNVLELSEEFNVSRFIMISTDKAVNPTNVMGATKRMCEMLVQSFSSRNSATTYSTTRFGNVLGSHGSVIPLFKRQIMHGGPVTLTDYRIIRYFMTIPEASQLVLESGALAKNGELYVLDMGKPVKILELAESMIRLSGYEPYKDIQIVETGLRPGEKLYEELLVRKDELNKTENELIFVENVQPVSFNDISEKLDMLSVAVATEDDDVVRAALAKVVPTYRTPDYVNNTAESADEMKLATIGSH
jgi:FlaA1/EpsC-like NDP-sugar epimerase